MPRWKEEGIQPDVIVVVPPLKGLDLAFIEEACATGPERIVYVSCNPASLARELVHFKERGYEAQYLQPVDMFPMTAHVETVSLLCKRDINNHIKVKVQLDEKDVAKLETN